MSGPTLSKCTKRDDILAGFKRVALCHQPTALEQMPRLTEALGGPRLWIKRDDCTGLATGGNKTRKLEFLMADALSVGPMLLLPKERCNPTMFARLQLLPVSWGSIVMRSGRRVPDRGQAYEQTGNVLFDHIFNTQIGYQSARAGYECRSQSCDRTAKTRREKALLYPRRWLK